MSEPTDGTTSYELEWRFSERIATEHLGSQKYSTSTRAIRELVANAFDADATSVEIELKENELGGLESVVVSDNGHGISSRALRERFMEVGVEPMPKGVAATRLGRFGVGRLAVHRIGTLSRWTSVSESENGTRVCITFTLTDQPSRLKVREEPAPAAGACGTTIEIRNIRDAANQKFTTGHLASDLLSHYCSYLLANPTRQIRVQGELLDVQDIIETRESETIPCLELVPQEATLEHLLLRRAVDQSRFPAQVVFSGKGRTVATVQSDAVPCPNYLALIECPYLDSIVTSSRDLLIEMDQGFAQLRDAALERIRLFGERHRAARKRGFIRRAREEEYYPYRSAPRDAVAGAQQAIYDLVLEKVNESANLEAMSKRQQQVVFRLLKRSLDNENVLDVLEEVARLSDEDMEAFRKLLERTTLDSILKLSSEVTHRLDFLDVLYRLVYGDVAAHLKERSQLHKILEPDCWIFGSQFHLATSDQSFREVVRQHRIKAGLADISDQAVGKIAGVGDIPDLFLAAVRDYPTQPKHHHLLVELKAPSVSLGRKEVEQIRRYAETILSSEEFDKQSTRWDLHLVSATATRQIERDRNQRDKPPGCLWDWDNMTVWAFQWSEIITKAKDEMQLVRDHLKRKSEDLTVSDYLREQFPDILESLSNELSGKQPL